MHRLLREIPCLATLLWLTAIGTAWAEPAQAEPTATEASVATPEPESPAVVCARWHETAQVERLDGRLLEAREALLSCASEECPSFVRVDCVEWLDEVRAQIPTVIFEATSDDGLVTDVAVSVGDDVLTTKLDGQPIEVAVGLSVFTFTRVNGERKTLRVLLRPGETNRIVSVDFRRPEKAPAPPTQSTAESAPPPVVEKRPVPLSVWIFGGTAVLATVTGGALGTIAKVEESNASGSCAPHCSDEVVSNITSLALAADISFATAVATGLTATILYITRPTIGAPLDRTRVATLSLRPRVLASPTVAWLGVEGRFR